MTQAEKQFNASEHLIQLKSKNGTQEYLPVAWRLVWYRECCPEGTIDTEELEFDTEKECSVEVSVWNPDKRRSEKVVKTAKGYARYRAIITDGRGGRATGTGSECAADFADYGEKAETKAIGRALAALGYGTQFAPDMEEAHRIVDSPVETRQDEPQHHRAPSPSTHSPSPSNVVSLPPQGQAEAIENGQDKKSPVDTLYIRAKEVGAIDKALRGEAGGIAFLKWASGILGATISHVNQLTPSRLKTLEEALEKKDAA